MSGRRLFGVESEYAATAVGADGRVFPPLEVGGALLRAASQTLPNLPSTSGAGVFLGNGSRVYLDSGAHPEIAGPECLNPWDTVRYLRAGDRLLLRLAEVVRDRNPVLAEVRLFSGNVDYSESRATWGSHENYCHRASPRRLQRQLIPHLVSRVIVCGAGGFNPLARGLVFTLSPRAHYLTEVASDATTARRGLVNTRAESLAGHGYHRQHLICGESLRSDIASWLRVGTTALVVAMVDGGVACGERVALARPLDALRTVAGDVSCRRALPLEAGGAATAVQIQRHYLELARAHQCAPFMPPWAGEVCDRWGDMLTRLEGGPERVSATLDWAIKLTIFRDRARRRGIGWTSRATRPRTGNGDEMPALGRELLELDMRWGLLGSGGLFEALDRAGVLDHRVAGVDRVEEAIEQPPSAGRARVRGAVIQRVWKEPGRYTSDWDHVWNHQSHARLELSDPWTEEERWRTPRAHAHEWSENPAACRPSTREASSLLGDVGRLLQRLGRRATGGHPAD